MKFSKSVLTATIAATLSLNAIAAEQAPIIVTATRTAQTADESLASVTVITAKEIEQQQAIDLTDLLDGIAGIDITSNGGLGKNSSLFIRGTNSSHVLVMIDGIKVGSATSGSAAFQHIPLAQIERIEIVRGPRAALYGSEAVGGVIQIFTKKASSTTQRYVELGLGSNATQSASAGTSGKMGSTSYAVNINQLSTAGINVQEDITTNKDADGYENTSLSLNLSHQFSKTSSLQLNAMHAFGNNEYDNEFSADNVSNYVGNFIQQTTGVQYTVVAMPNWNIKLNAAQSLDNTETVVNALSKSEFNTTRDTLSWQNDISLSDNQLITFGIDNQTDTVDSTKTYEETSRSNTATFIQHQWNGENNDVNVAMRNDDNQAFGTHTTGSIALGHNFANTMRFIASYGTAFKAPSFNQLYYPNYGNADVKPETSSSTEIELRKKHSWGKTSISVYQTSITDLIAVFPVANVNKAEINGVELRVNAKIADWDTQLEFASIDPRDTETNKILQRRSQQTIKLSLDKQYGKWTSGLNIINHGARFDDADNTDELAGYTLVNLRTSYAVSEKLSVKAKIENLLAEKYETAMGYSNPGLTAFVAVKYQGF